jgi:hypothetical protein
MNPLEVQGKTLANQLQGQTYNTNRPKEMVAQANATDPNWLKGELAQQALQGQAQTAETQGKIQGLTRAAVMNTLEKWVTKQPSPLEMQFDIKDFNDQDKQMLMELYKNPKGYLEKMREQDAQRAWQAKKMETESRNANNIEVAKIRAADSGSGGGGSSSTTYLNLEKDLVKAQNDWLAAGKPKSGPVYDKYAIAYELFSTVTAAKARPYSIISPEGIQTGTPTPMPANPPGMQGGAGPGGKPAELPKGWKQLEPEKK